MDLGYFYSAESLQFAFFRIPKLLFTEQYSVLSTDAKLLYGLLLDRMELSAANGWLDEQGRVYIYYTIENIAEDLDCSRCKAMSLMAELEERATLIERKRQGRGKPTRIYVKRFRSNGVDLPSVKKSKIKTSKIKTSKNQTRRSLKFRPQEVYFLDPNNTEYNKTDINKTDVSSRIEKNRAEIFSRVRRQINYPLLIDAFDSGNLDELVELMVDIVCSTVPTVTAGGEQIPTADIQSCFAQLDYAAAIRLLEQMEKEGSQISEPRQHLLNSVYENIGANQPQRPP